jgi:hypothetical protein
MRALVEVIDLLGRTAWFDEVDGKLVVHVSGFHHESYRAAAEF